MLNQPPHEVLDQLPRIYETSCVPLEAKVIHAHFFCGPADWYVAEYDGEDEFFGFANLGDDDMAEWGSFSLNELKEICVPGSPVIESGTGVILGRLVLMVEWDEYWKPRPFGEIQWRKQP